MRKEPRPRAPQAAGTNRRNAGPTPRLDETNTAILKKMIVQKRRGGPEPPAEADPRGGDRC